MHLDSTSAGKRGRSRRVYNGYAVTWCRVRNAADTKLILSLILLSAGSMISNMPAWVADRYTENGEKTKITSQGEEVIVDAQLTLQSIYSLLYWYV